MYSISSFTSPRMLLSLAMAKQSGKFPTPQRGEVRTFVAVALTDAIPMSTDQFDKWLGETDLTATYGGKDTTGRLIVKARIVKDENGVAIEGTDNPHIMYDDPCDYNESDQTEFEKALGIIATYPTFITAKDFSLTDDATIRKNDQIFVTLRTDSTGHIIEDNGFIMGLFERAGVESTGLTPCQSLADRFNGAGSYANLGSGPLTARTSNRPAGSDIEIGKVMVQRMKDSGYFDGYGDAFLSGLAANAVHESGGNAAAAGDSATAKIGTPSANKNRIDIDGTLKCSFGYWQLNVCSTRGGGQQFAEYHNHPTRVETQGGQNYTIIESNKQTFYADITDQDKQFDYVSDKMSSMFGDATTAVASEYDFAAGKTSSMASYYGQQIAVRFEICQNCMPIGKSSGDRTDSETVKRGVLAAAIFEAL